MNDQLENHVSRAQKVLQFLIDHVAEFTTTPSLADALKTELTEGLAKVPDDQSRSEADLTGFATTKQGYRTTLDNSVIHVASGLVAYFENQNDLVNMHLFDFPNSTIQGFRDNRIVSFSKMVYDKANISTISDGLHDRFNVTPDDISNLNTQRTTYVDYIGQPLEKRDEASAYTLQTERDVDALNETCAKIERRMRSYFITNRTLWDIFDAANHIDDTGSVSTTAPLTGTVAAAASIKVTDVDFNSAAAITMNNTGSTASLRFSFKKAGSPPATSNPVTVLASNIVNTTFGAIGNDTDELWVENIGADVSNYSVTI